MGSTVSAALRDGGRYPALAIPFLWFDIFLFLDAHPTPPRFASTVWKKTSYRTS